MHFITAATFMTLLGTALGSQPVEGGKLYSPKEYAFEDYKNGTMGILPLADKGKRQFEFCDYWDAWVLCTEGLSDTNICTDTYCSCEGADILCDTGTTCLETCQCYVYCADDW